MRFAPRMELSSVVQWYSAHLVQSYRKWWTWATKTPQKLPKTSKKQDYHI